MAGQAILGDMVLKSAIAMEYAAPTVEMLVADHAGMVFRIAYSILRNHHDAEDATGMLSPGLEKERSFERSEQFQNVAGSHRVDHGAGQKTFQSRDGFAKR
jgi:hypothetical protein